MKKKTASALNGYLANVAVVYFKLHCLHWNVVGRDFLPVHAWLEELYERFAALLDELAECLKMYGEQPLATMKSYLDAATVREADAEELRSDTALSMVQEDLRTLRSQAEAIRAAAEEEGLHAVAAQMDNHLADYQKELWFLKATLKGK